MAKTKGENKQNNKQKQEGKTAPKNKSQFSANTFLLVILAVLLSYVLYILQSHGVFRDVVPFGDEECRVVKGIVGSEDMEVHDDLLFVSSDGFSWFHPGAHLETKSEFELIAESKKNGSIYTYDFKLNEPKIVEVEREGGSGIDFHPHGIGLLVQKDRSLMFVVNHKRDGDSVDVFEVEKRPSPTEPPKKMKFLYSISAGKVYWNDVTPVSETSFYVSRHNFYKQGEWMNLIETVTMKPWGKVVFCKVDDLTGKNPVCKDVVNGAASPNGVTLSHDKKFLFMSEMMAKDVIVFQRNFETNELTPLYRVNLGYLGDNFFLDDTGLYVAGHINSIKTKKHIHYPTIHHSPSQVSRITGDFNNKTSLKVETILINDGQLFSGATVAVRYGNNLIIGTITDTGFVICPLKD